MTRAPDIAAVKLPVGARFAVVAGSGALPHSVVETLIASGKRPIVIAMEGEAEGFERNAAGLQTADIWPAPLESLPSILPKLKREGVTHLVLAGGVARRPSLLALRPGIELVRVLPRLAAAYARGDDGLLRAIVGHVESRGICVVGAHEIVPDLLAPKGPLGRVKPLKRHQADIKAAFDAARAIGALDIGQAAIAIGGRAVALEGIEGTAGLLERTVALRDHGRLAGKKGGVLAKCVKPGQELRADLPAIGPDTIDAAHRAGLSGIALECERCFVLEFGETVARADNLGLFIVGLEPETDG